MATPRSIDRLTPGGRIGPYLLLEPLGSGGSGRVWAVARIGQLGFSKRMVLKVMREDKLGSERAHQRFDREARLGARLRHPNLRAVHDLGSHQGRPFMSLSWVDTSLDELLRHAPQRKLEPAVACWLGIQTCAALSAAHGHVNHRGEPSTIVHGDVSPGNILLTQRGHVLLADLAASDEGASSAARAERGSGRFFGSVGYAAPEALRGEALDPRADLFSLGCVLYEALCGAPAFEGDDERWVACQVLEHDPVELQRRAPEVPPALAAVLQRAMRRAAAERFADAAAMRKALLECVQGLSAFALEERAAAVIASVLGERLVQREQRMRAVFQRFSLLQLERTDTLPIGQPEPRSAAGNTLTTSSPGLERRSKQERPRSRAPLLALLGLALALVVTASRLRRSEGMGAPAQTDTALAALSRELPDTAGTLPAGGAVLAPDAGAARSQEQPPAQPARVAAPAADAKPPRGQRPARRQKPAASRPAADAPHSGEFVWRLPKNPYARPAKAGPEPRTPPAR